jgi:hypothetical protein
MIDVAIPGVIGVLLAVKPQLFCKASGDAVSDAEKAQKLRRIGWLLLGVAGLYLIVKLMYAAAHAT